MRKQASLLEEEALVITRPPPPETAEWRRLEEDKARKNNWKRWGPYLSERQWGTVREDYSADGNCWEYFTHDQARSRAYRWGEDGILGICDRECRLCFSMCLWNGKDPIMKERLFGLINSEGNHGEDVKELYYYLESTPSHSYMKGLYKYPQREYPYERLVAENRNRGKDQREFELLDTGIFEDNRYWDVFVEYAKNSPNDILIRVTIANRGPEEAEIHVLPTFLYRNTWSWGCKHEGCWVKPSMRHDPQKPGRLECRHVSLGEWYIETDSIDKSSSSQQNVSPANPSPRPSPRSSADDDDSSGSSSTAEDCRNFLESDPRWLLTDNETNMHKLWGVPNEKPYVKDSFHSYVIHGDKSSVHPQRGTKAAAYHTLRIPPGQSAVIKLRMYAKTEEPKAGESFGTKFEQIFAQRIKEKDQYYDGIVSAELSAEERKVMIQSFAGLLWSKQFYHYVIEDWMQGDPEQPKPPEVRMTGRNADWRHLFNRDVISMPDKWEYPWYATWDLAFHCVALSVVDADFAKEQLLLFLREWYMHPNGAIPAYEFAFSDVNPPVHAWATWQVYKQTANTTTGKDRVFLAKVFQKLMINFTWWVNRKDVSGKHIFSGGFLGLDNIGVFDRSKPLKTGAVLEQADGTAWMAFYCIYMLKIALELAEVDEVYEDIASKFFEHFISIADAMNSLGGAGLWDTVDGFYYDQLRQNPTEKPVPMRLRSVVGVVPLFAVMVLSSELMKKLSGFSKRTDWFLKNRHDLASQISFLDIQTTEEQLMSGDKHKLYLLAVANKEKAQRVFQYVFDEQEFLSKYGMRSLSKFHLDHPFVMHLDGEEHRVRYNPAESESGLFGGNSNWRGPIWMPMNYLILQSLERFHHFYGDSLKVSIPCAEGGCAPMNLAQASDLLRQRLVSLFLPNPNQGMQRPIHGNDMKYANDPHFKDLVLFYEYFDGCTGRGLGASHQTGWTALIANVLVQIAEGRETKKRGTARIVPAADLARAAEEEKLRHKHKIQTALKVLPKNFLSKLGMTEEDAREPILRFLHADKDHSGSLKLPELIPLLTVLYANRMAPENIRRLAALQFQIADRDNSGALDLEEFLDIYTAIKKEIKPK